jgi:hypothetical protein
METGEDEDICPGQEIDFCTLGMFIIGKKKLSLAFRLKSACFLSDRHNTVVQAKRVP